MKIRLFEKLKHSTPLHYREGQGVGLLVSLFLCSFVALSCSNIEESERFIYVPPTEVQRAVLIEDFTGQACVNCPAATEKIHELQQAYGEGNIIPVAIHSGPFAHRRSNMNGPFLSDLGTVEGDEYYTHWSIEAQPGVKINRGQPIYDTNQYAAAVAAELQKKTLINIEKVNFSAIPIQGQNDKLLVQLEITTGESVDAQLQVWLVEDNINAEGGNNTYVQLMGDGSTNTNYVHNHVFRASMTQGLYGDVVKLLPGNTLTKSFELEQSASWNKDHLSVVIFLWNEQKGVLQVRRVPFNTLEIIDN